MATPDFFAQLTRVELELIYENVKYRLTVSQSGPHLYHLQHGDSWIGVVEAHSLADGGLLISMDGASHVVYAQEQTVGLRLIVDGKTCLFSEEYDPTVLRVGMPGKLIRYLVAGKLCERLEHGERAELVLAALAARPWQTPQELGANHLTLRRLLDAGRLQRRRRALGGKTGWQYEWALADCR